ncbi:hypothetical protein M8C13_42035 [Crossiella sp. SN42]|uniref:hypothetical protein n=1 Tax=Crossiella sp. SN42 TaxID=2944808 RepID=UPI00207D3990|nr:hypothetical protein [Crossiella sp. SN42]MCO1582349.1 hypothetical protein [Crossiella sp. SN42]
MVADRPGPTDEDGPLFRSAYEHADAVDKAEGSTQRRRAWAGFLPRAVVALAEGFLRDWMIVGAVLFSVIVGFIGGSSGDVWWTVGCVVAAVAGVVLVLLAVARRWSFGRQWSIIVGVLTLQIVIMVVFWRTH